MNTEQRELARLIIAEITSFNYWNKIKVVDGKIHVNSDMGEEARRIVRDNKVLLIRYLTTPPRQAGICHRGHDIQWRVSNHGIWLCECYFTDVTSNSDTNVTIHKPDHTATTKERSLTTYWQEGQMEVQHS